MSNQVSAGARRAFGQELDNNALRNIGGKVKKPINADAGSAGGTAGGPVTDMDITLDGNAAIMAAGQSMTAAAKKGFACDIAGPDSHLRSLPYIARIVNNNFNTEEDDRPRPDYMAGVQQTDAVRAQDHIHHKMRTILLNWIAEVHGKFKLRQVTLFLTANIMDRYLSMVPIAREKLQLVGCTAMWIACKYHEIYAPSVRDFTYISDRAFNKKQMIGMEEHIVKTLNFKLTIPTSLSFLARLNNVATGVMGAAAERCNHLSNYLLERSLLDYKMLKYKPSVLAAACCYTACTLTAGGVWHDEIARAARTPKHEMAECIEHLRYYVMANDPKLAAKHRSVIHKYAKQKYGQVSKLRPRRRN